MGMFMRMPLDALVVDTHCGMMAFLLSLYRMWADAHGITRNRRTSAWRNPVLHTRVYAHTPTHVCPGECACLCTQLTDLSFAHELRDILVISLTSYFCYHCLVLECYVDD